jgi:tripartite-type tricarboxylate transporter receptor subunit TctC
MAQYLMACLALFSLVFTAVPDKAQAAGAADYPGNRTIQLVIPAGAGGGTDVSGRTILKYLIPEIGNIVVVNVKGGAGAVGNRQVKDAKPDGYTLAYYNECTVLNELSKTSDFGMDMHDSYVITALVETTALASNKFKTVDEAVAWGKANPGKLKFGMEYGSYNAVLAAAFMTAYGLAGQLIDVGPTIDQIASLAGGHTDLIVSPLGTIKDYIKAGEFHVLAMLNEKRYDKAPEISTLVEKGIDCYLPRFYYFGFPKGSPVEYADKFYAAVKKVSANPAYLKDMETLEMTVKYMTPAESKKYIDDSFAVYERYQKYFDDYIAKQRK